MANLLGELYHAKKRGEKFLDLDPARITENPTHRIERLITTSWWDNLTRRLDASGIARAAPDPKPGSEDISPRIYVPPDSPEQYALFSKFALENPEMRLDVQWLPKGEITAEFIRTLNESPGLLALGMEKVELNGRKEYNGFPFVVPGGRFNELYNWDAVFCAYGMVNTHRSLVQGILRNFIYEIKHYGKILNANRSYYLGRSQPPLLTDLALRLYRETRLEHGAKDLLRHALLAAMKEYYSYWMTTPRYDPDTGLSRYRPIGFGICPEVPIKDYTHVLEPYAEKYNMKIEEFGRAYTNRELKEPDLDVYFLHDRAVRENGHDTTNRLEGVCADLGTVDLNCLLYRYETDIATTISTVFDDNLVVPKEYCAPGQTPDHVETSSLWNRAVKKRKQMIDKYLWNEEKGMYFDYNTVTKKQMSFEYVTTFWPLWCGAASPHQAASVVKTALPKFECLAGLSSSTEKTRGVVSHKNPQKQWDYPFGWAPHQIMAWDGLKLYGYHENAERLIYKWLHMMMKVFRDYNGAVVEKYDVTDQKAPHKVTAEYGNQGLAFKYAPEEG